MRHSNCFTEQIKKTSGIVIGAVACLLDSKRNRFGGAFNCQLFRQLMFFELQNKVGFSAIVETGTFQGITTEFLHKTSRLPTYTAEIHPKYYGYSKTRFLLNNKIKVFFGNSTDFLKSLLKNPEFIQKKLFFYLDAHWEENLVLKEEIQIIFENFPSAIVMIDDFKIPTDEGYGYDDYGDGKTLCLEYLNPLSHLKLAYFFPSQESKLETGYKRGCIVLARSPDLIEKLKHLDTLMFYNNQA